MLSIPFCKGLLVSSYKGTKKKWNTKKGYLLSKCSLPVMKKCVEFYANLAM